MARIYRSDVIQKAVNDLALSPSVDHIPQETLDKVQLTYSLNKQFSSFSVFNGSASTGNITVTMPSTTKGQEIYLTSLMLSYVKDVTCDVGTGAIVITGTTDQAGISVSLLRSSILTLTAERDTVVLTFPYPLKLKSGTDLTVTGKNFTAGSLRADATACGFITSSN